jgi:hypothetical protein
MPKVYRPKIQRGPIIECGGNDIFRIYEGIKIAKRGHPGTPQGKIWIALEPGWSVRDRDGGNTIEVEHQGIPVQ